MQGSVNKGEWVAMFRQIGLTDDDMDRWHREFERRHPDGHAGFLTWLGLSSDEIADIRARYR